MSRSALQCFDTRDREFRADPTEPGLATGAFAGHRWFAADLVEWLKPSHIVELGTELGCSFSAFGEGLAKLDASERGSIRCVDLWSGFEEYGFISSDDSYSRFLNVAALYPEVDVTVSRMSFDEAAASQSTEIDLLLIDGVHTFEACRHDFLTWRPFLSSRAVVLFHDTAPGHGNGSSDYWREIKTQHPHMDFTHSYGLGVLLLGSEYLELGSAITLPTRPDWYEFRWRAAIAERQVADHIVMVEDRDALVEQQALLLGHGPSAAT